MSDSMASAITTVLSKDGKGVSTSQLTTIAASLGVSVAFVRWVLKHYRRQGDGDDSVVSEEVIVLKRGYTGVFKDYIKDVLRRMLLDPDDLHFDPMMAKEVHVVDPAVITHQGSCHCQSVKFEIQAPRTIIAKEGPGKIQYRYTEISSDNFRVVRGQNHLKTYYVVVKATQDRGAHAFCERCGCHVLYAPSKSSHLLKININCVDEGIHKIRLTKKKAPVSEGVVVDSQFDDPLSTISEATQELHFNIPPATNKMESFSEVSTDLKLYDEVEALEPTSTGTPQKEFYVSPSTPTTIGSFTANATDTQSLPPFRIQPGVSDASSVITESDMYSTTHSENGYPNQPKPLPQLRDQMKYYMKKHVSANSPARSLADEKKTTQ